MTTLFLTAKWRHLVMINYEVDPSILAPYLPRGTEIDFWNGKAYISLVGFMFLNTCVKGFFIPFHRDFEEVNLRFYVKSSSDRGVVFIKEIVPKRAIALVARRLYNENYVAMPMNHILLDNSVEYQWKYNGKWQKIGVQYHGDPKIIQEGSFEEYITEHYWGYTAQLDGSTLAYKVEHPKWRVWKADSIIVDIDTSFYGSFAPFLISPVSSFLAEGSDVKVFRGDLKKIS